MGLKIALAVCELLVECLDHRLLFIKLLGLLFKLHDDLRINRRWSSRWQ